jgi:hypothetical protein
VSWYDLLQTGYSSRGRRRFIRGPANLSKASFRGDAPNLVRTAFSEPEVAVGSGCDGNRTALRYRDGKLGDHTARGDAPDPVPHRLGKPEVILALGI